jgi:hypothetical protein
MAAARFCENGAMKLLGKLCTVFGLGIMFAACVAGEPDAQDHDSQQDQAADVKAPAELQLRQLPASSCGSSGVSGGVAGGGCSFDVICKDPNHGCNPSYCSYDCASGEGRELAADWCESHCGANAACWAGTLAYRGSCQ